jgi:hypothetical protein
MYMTSFIRRLQKKCNEYLVIYMATNITKKQAGTRMDIGFRLDQGSKFGLVGRGALKMTGDARPLRL